MVPEKPRTARTPPTKIVVPSVPTPFLARPALERRLEEGSRRRLTTVVGGAGFGKSTLLATWASGINCAWYAVGAEDADLAGFARGLVRALRLRLPSLPSEILTVLESPDGPDARSEIPVRAEAYAALICDALAGHLRRDLVLVLDDVHELGPLSVSGRLVEALCRGAPGRLHLVLASRRDPPFPIERLRAQGQVVTISAAELAFTVAEIDDLLVDALGDGWSDLAGDLHETTDGWPAAVRLAIEGLHGVAPAERPRALGGLRRRGGPLFSFVATEVFEHEPSEVRRLLAMVAPLTGFTPELVEALGVPYGGDVLGALAKRGLFLELPRSEVAWYSLSELVREFALEHHPLPPSELAELHRGAAAWFEAHGYWSEAVRSLAAVADHAEIRRFLTRNGEDMLRGGAAETVITASRLLPADHRGPLVDELDGVARQTRGDWDGALACLDRAAGGAGRLGAGLAYRLGLIHHFRGRLDLALETYARGRVDGSAPRDEALLLAWRASAHWLRGDADACRLEADRSFALATAAGDAQALAAAHTVRAMLAALDGDRGANDAHYLRALEYAEQSGDLLQIARIHINRASRFLEEGLYEEALAELDAGLPVAEVAGFASFRALGLTNRGEASFFLGRLEQAIADLDAAKAVYQAIGSRMAAYPLQKLGDVYRERGDLVVARAAYEEAIQLGDEADDVQGLVPALAGLACLLAADDPDEAAALAERALARASGLSTAGALIAGGRVASARGDRAEAHRLALEAAAVARARRDRAGLAEALDLQASASAPVPARELLAEARAIWQEVRNPLGEARTNLAIATLVGGAASRGLLDQAERSFQQLGARGHAAAAAALRASLDERAGAPVTIKTLGRFLILRDGEAVRLADWQSKKARDLLKMLIARRGHPAPRDALMEALWPDQDPRKLANRLSVALATVRGVLDPTRRFPSGHFVTADQPAVRLDLSHVSIDVETFLAAAADGLALRRRGRRSDAHAQLVAAEAAYTGDFLEEDIYEDWAIPLRQEAHAAYVEVAQALAEDAASAGDHDAASRYYLRILERDHDDERAHLGLVSTFLAAGRHGEARRSFRSYRSRMEKMGVESAPFPETAPAGAP